MKPLVECGICDQYHPEKFGGDCRDKANRFSVDDPVAVVFRRWRDVNGRGIIALFPGIPAYAHAASSAFCSSFEHVGQHSPADYPGVIAQTMPATPEEYADLKRELESAPYNYVLRVVKRRGKCSV
jgi:hypothetical protein